MKLAAQSAAVLDLGLLGRRLLPVRQREVLVGERLLLVDPRGAPTMERCGRRCPQGPAAGSCCDGRRSAPTPLCCSLWDRAANSLHSLRSLRSNRRGEVSFGCALRAPIPETALLAATEIARRRPLRAAPAALQPWCTSSQTPAARFRAVVLGRSRYSPAFANALLTFVAENPTVTARQAVPGGGDFGGGEPSPAHKGPEGALWLAKAGALASAPAHSPWVGARSALPKLTRRACLSVVSAANEASSRRDPRASSTAESARSADRPSMSPRRASSAAPRGRSWASSLTSSRALAASIEPRT